MNTYVAFYKNRRIEVSADTIYAAQKLAAAQFKAKKSYEVHIVLAAKNGEAVIHTAVN